MKSILSVLLLLLLEPGYAQTLTSEMPPCKIELITTSGNRFVGWIIVVEDSLLHADPCKKRDNKGGNSKKPASFYFHRIKSIKILQKNEKFIINGDLKSFGKFRDRISMLPPAISSSDYRRRLNFIVSPRMKKIDPSFLSFQMQVRLMRIFHGNKLYLVTAASSANAVKKIKATLDKEKAMIGNIWFDSHGKYASRKSLFSIGQEDFTYAAIKDSLATHHLKELSPYCDTTTQVGIGSCYGGASFTLPAIEDFPAHKMNGDSLMIGLSRLLGNATVYACESFVMTGPGLLNVNYSLCGTPARKKYKDPLYRPVWERAGEWNRYSGKSRSFGEPVSVTLRQDGTIGIKDHRYLQIKKNKEKLTKKLKKFRSGNYNIALLYRN
ncbi:hypothetical protein [Flavihumibacter sp. ZG627]|uniref:hypothetical protein n=1 Tax=Flavihumibacter sp. ZG627 TaxID=1463156 RepID=UPI000580590F|nr:hypothetical protein [Flavihumibacter sp. ZG627]KIC89533.1 hypothetical protein HY58_15540 [Flavihumibacter sp. ZG627]